MYSSCFPDDINGKEEPMRIDEVNGPDSISIIIEDNSLKTPRET